MKIFLVVLFSEKTPWKNNLFTSKVTPNNYKIKGASGSEDLRVYLP